MKNKDSTALFSWCDLFLLGSFDQFLVEFVRKIFYAMLFEMKTEKKSKCKGRVTEAYLPIGQASLPNISLFLG